MPRAEKPLFVIFLGQIGAGKSYFARQLAPRINAVRLNADAARLAMYGSLEAIHTENGHGEENNRKLFPVIDYAAREILAAGTSVVYDTARFNGLKNREIARDIAKQAGAELIIVWVETPRDVATTRVLGREEQEDQRRVELGFAEKILDFHYDNFGAPQPGEKAIKISGQVPFEEQYAQFEKELHAIIAKDE